MTTPDQPIIIDMTDPATQRAFQMAQCIASLKIEISTGLKHSRGSVLRLVQDRYGITKRTKKGALNDLLHLYYTETGRKYGSR